MPKVSVIIPIYNTAEYIGEAIESILSQTYKDFEIIVVDDGSTDNVRGVLKKYMDIITYIRQDNKGHAIARNTGIKIAKGEYIAFLDADDIWLPNKLNLQIAAMKNNSRIGLAHSNVYILNEYSGDTFCPARRKKLLNGDVFKNILLRNEHISSPTVIVRKACMDEVGLFDENMTRLGSEDRDLWLRITKKFQAQYIDRPLAYYRVRENSQSRNYENMFKGRIYSLNKLFKENSISSILRRKAYCNAYYDYAMEVIYKGDLGLGLENYIASIRYWPLSGWRCYNFIKPLYINYLKKGKLCS